MSTFNATGGKTRGWVNGYLFFWFADRFEYPWRKRLDACDYDLGSGKRVVAVGGQLDKHYHITVPREQTGE